MNEQIHKQSILKLEEKISELKTELTQLKTALETKVRQYESDRAHLEAWEMALKENYETMKVEKEKTE